ncbi:MAG: MFS transporter [Clostridiales bacterium]|jgi:MFS family permease|nr:MFS transporter [Clostridiales bacterium]
MPSFSLLRARILRSVRSFSTLDAPVKIYVIEGILLSIVSTILSNNNNLFANRLGANDYQLGLLSSIPQLVNILILLPGGVIADSLKNKKRMVLGTISASGVLYLAIGLATGFAQNQFIAFLALFATSAGTTTLYSISWQSLFPDVISIEKRNKTLTLRTFGVMLISVISPLATGSILSSIGTNEGKIAAHQTFFVLVGVLTFVQVFALSRLKPQNAPKPQGMSLKALKEAGAALLRNKRFIYFASVTIFFYMTWHMDWTLFYIGQTQYLGFNEFQLALATVLAGLAQFLTLRFWSRVNERKGVIFAMLFGVLGLAFPPISMIVGVSLPQPLGKIVFLVMYTISCLGFATVTLNVFQCLLQVLDEKNRALSISIFTVFSSLSNACLPMFGVMLYKWLGGNLSGLKMTFAIIFVLRIIAAGLWFKRYLDTKDEFPVRQG